MTEGQSFLLLLALFYLEEASYWLPHGTVLARLPATGGGAHRPKGWSNSRGILAWLPFFGAGRRSPAAFWPFSVTEEGLSSRVVPSPNPGWVVPHSGVTISWEDAREIVAENRKLRVNGKPFATCVSAATAHSSAVFLRKIRDVGREARAGVIAEAAGAACDAGAAREALGRVWDEGRWCRIFSGLVFPVLFFVIPAGYWLLGSGPPLYMMIGLLWGIMVTGAVLFFRAHDRLFPELRGERWQHLLVAAVAAPHAARLPDVLARNALGLHWPLAVSPEGSALGDALRRDLAHPIGGRRDAVAAAFYRRHLGGRGTIAPLPGPGFVCPRCLGEFSFGEDCPDCPGVLLVAGSGGSRES